MPPDLGGRPHMERDQAAVGRRVEGIRERHVERRRLHHQLPLRRHHRAQIACLLRREFFLSSFCAALTTFMPHLPLGKRSGGEMREPTFQRHHLSHISTTYFQPVKKPHISKVDCQYHIQCKFTRFTRIGYRKRFFPKFSDARCGLSASVCQAVAETNARWQNDKSWVKLSQIRETLRLGYCTVGGRKPV